MEKSDKSQQIDIATGLLRVTTTNTVDVNLHGLWSVALPLWLIAIYCVGHSIGLFP